MVQQCRDRALGTGLTTTGALSQVRDGGEVNEIKKKPHGGEQEIAKVSIEVKNVRRFDGSVAFSATPVTTHHNPVLLSLCSISSHQYKNILQNYFEII